jgi:Spx/MgsR family transcriptional regulator
MARKAAVRKAKSKGATRRKARKSARFLHKPACTTCRKARSYMEKRGFGLHFRDLAKERLSAAELEKLIGRRDHNEFLNPRNELYRERNMKDNPPSRSEAIRLMAKEPNLIRRPVILCGGRLVLGFNREAIDNL